MLFGLEIIGLIAIAKFLYTKFRPWLFDGDDLAMAKAEAAALRKWVKTELGKMNRRISKESDKKPTVAPEPGQLTRMDDGVVAANPFLHEADADTLAAYGIHKKADGFYMEAKPPIDPRDKVMAMSPEDIITTLDDINPLGEPRITEAEATTWLKTASLEDLAMLAIDQRALRKRAGRTIKVVTDEIDRRLDALHQANDDE